MKLFTRRLAWTAAASLALASLTGCLVGYDSPPMSRPQPMPPSVPAAPPAAVDVGFFYDALDPYGDWIQLDQYGWVWAPGSVDPFWRPYTVGRWVWTDYGWTWVSNESWGWATYHYGRWVRAPRYGWVWVPGNEWGPAWVAWRNGPGVVGWAPLPPQVRFRAEIGLDWGGLDIDVVIGSDWWCFVDEPRLVDPDVARWAYPIGRNATVWRATRDATRVRMVDRRIVNDGYDRQRYEREYRRAVPVRRITDLPDSAGRRSEVVGDEVRFFRPKVSEGRKDAVPPRAQRPAAGPGRAPEGGPPAGEGDPDAMKRWDRRWNEDWRKLQREQDKDVKKVAPPPAKPPEQVRERHQEENYQAAENARREQVAAQERAKRQAVRKPVTPAKKDDKKEQKKDEKKNDRR